MASGLLDKANIILTPTGYKAGTMYNVAPIEQPYEDFDFARASVASRVNSSGLVEMVGRTLGSNLVQNGDFSEIGTDLVQNGTFDLGSELVTNGDFATDSDWVKGTYTSIENGKAVITNSTGEISLRQSLGVAQKTIKVTYTISDYVSGVLRIQYGAINGTNRSANGTYTDYITGANASQDLLIYSLTSNTTLSIDNVSVKEVPDWSLTQATVSNNTLQLSTTDGSYTAATQSLGSIGESYKIQLDVSNIVGTISVAIGGGTDVDITTNGTHTIYIKSASTTFELKRKFGITNISASITNVVVQELDPNDYWTLGTSWSLGDEEAVASNSSSYIKQNNVIDNNKTFKVQFDTVVTSGQFRLVATADAATYTSYVTESGTYTFYMKPTVSINGGLEFVGSSFTGTITNVTAQEVIDTNNIPRINYDSNGENGHWLLEPTSTNLLPYSEDFTNWTKLNGGTGSLPVVTSNTSISPSGEQNADTISFDKGAASGGGDYSLLRLDYGGADVDGTASIYLKADANVDIEISSDDVSYQTVSVTNTWQRFSVSDATSDRLSMGLRGTVPSNNTATVYAWGGQLEALPYATSYIPTLTGSTETRATETATGAGSADLINSTEGVLYAEIAALADDGTARNMALSDGTTSNRIVMVYTNVSNQIRFYLQGSGGTITVNHTLTNSTELVKAAVRYKSEDFAFYINGVQIDTNNSSITFSGLNDLSFHNPFGGGSSPFYGKCKELVVFNTALTDAELTELTS